VAITLGVFRPLLLATLDSEQALARGVPVGLLSSGFLTLLAGLTAEGTQAVGALLLLGLLAAPAGAARCMVTNPYAGAALASLLALIAMWAGLALSYSIGSVPPSSAIVGIAGAVYAGTATRRARRRRHPARQTSD
jgi:zinc/manganese transport system permease protein